MMSFISSIQNAFSGLRGMLPSTDRVFRSAMKATTKVPFVDDIFAMYYCARDPKTPPKIRFVIVGTLLYLVSPIDLIPDFLAVVGYTDDVTALIVAARVVSGHVSDDHRNQAAMRIAQMRGEA